MLLSAKVRTGLVRSSGEVATDTGLAERDAIAAALLACYLLIRLHEEAAASAAASTPAATS